MQPFGLNSACASGQGQGELAASFLILCIVFILNDRHSVWAIERVNPYLNAYSMVSVRFLVPPSWLNVARITGSRAEEGRWLGRQGPASASGLRSSRGRVAGGYVSQQREGGKGKKERRAFARLMTGHLQVGRSGAGEEGGHQVIFARVTTSRRLLLGGENACMHRPSMPTRTERRHAQLA